MTYLQKGDFLTATVVRLEDYGAWLDHRGQQVLVNIPEISWDRVRHPEDHLTIGQEVQVVVLHTHCDKVSASIKALYHDRNPWHPSKLVQV